MKKNKKVILISLISSIILIALLVILSLNKIKRTTYALEITDRNAEHLADGTYYGEYSIFPVKAKVSVHVQNKVIIHVNIISHQNGMGKDAEVVIQRVVEQQSPDVDVVSGATISSKCILKAIDNSLNQGETS